MRMRISAASSCRSGGPCQHTLENLFDLFSRHDEPHSTMPHENTNETASELRYLLIWASALPNLHIDRAARWRKGDPNFAAWLRSIPSESARPRVAAEPLWIAGIWCRTLL